MTFREAARFFLRSSLGASRVVALALLVTSPHWALAGEGHHASAEEAVEAQTTAPDRSPATCRSIRRLSPASRWAPATARRQVVVSRRSAPPASLAAPKPPPPLSSATTPMGTSNDALPAMPVVETSLASRGSSPKPEDFVAAQIDAPTADERLLVDLVNVERTTRNLRPVAWDGTLSRVARLHGADMRDVGKASHHSSRDGADYGLRLSRTSYRASAAAENVAYNRDVLRAHRALMDSPGHRANILDPNLGTVGMAVVADSRDDWVYVVEDFATPIADVSDTDAAAKLRESLSLEASARRRAGLPEDKALSSKLQTALERIIRSGTVRSAGDLQVGEGWTLAYTSMDPTAAPPSALPRLAGAESYALAVSFRKTSRYPFGTYWAILFLKDPG